MTALASRIPEFLDALLGLVGPAVEAEAAADNIPREVTLGAEPEGSDCQQRVYIGYGGNPTDTTLADFTRAWHGLGAGRQKEAVVIRCAVVCWSGDDHPDAAVERLAETFALFAPVDLAIRNAPHLGLPARPVVALLDRGQVVPDAGGRRVRLPFTVTITARI